MRKLNLGPTIAPRIFGDVSCAASVRSGCGNGARKRLALGQFRESRPVSSESLVSRSCWITNPDPLCLWACLRAQRRPPIPGWQTDAARGGLTGEATTPGVTRGKPPGQKDAPARPPGPGWATRARSPDNPDHISTGNGAGPRCGEGSEPLPQRRHP